MDKSTFDHNPLKNNQRKELRIKRFQISGLLEFAIFN